MHGRETLWVLAMAIAVALLLSAARADAVACTTRDECCGSSCDSGVGSLGVVCRAGTCTRARLTECAGDCDADAAVGIAELMVGVGVALDIHPLAACPNLDLDRDGAAGVNELVRAVRGALEGCAAAAARSPQQRGYYDAELTTLGAVTEASAAVYESYDGLALSIAEGPNQSIYLSGPLVRDHLTLRGTYIVTDIGFELRGEATVVSGEDAEVISGTIQSTSGGFARIPDAFVLRHSAAEKASRFSGSYTLRFNESPNGNGLPSSATVRLDVADDGFAFSGEAEDRGAGDVPYGTLTTGTCFIAPGGHLSCSMLYLLADSRLWTPLTLTGGLTANGGGGGEFLSGTDPPFGPEPYVEGSWLAD